MAGSLCWRVINVHDMLIESGVIVQCNSIYLKDSRRKTRPSLPFMVRLGGIDRGANEQLFCYWNVRESYCFSACRSVIESVVESDKQRVSVVEECEAVRVICIFKAEGSVGWTLTVIFIEGSARVIFSLVSLARSWQQFNCVSEIFIWTALVWARPSFIF